MGNAESSIGANDRPVPLSLEAKSLLERGFFEAAVTKYKRAYELYKESGANASAGRSLRHAAEAGLQITGSLPDYELASKAFEEVATLYLTNVITSLIAKTALANSIFCLLAAGRIATAKAKYDEYILKDSLFEGSVDGIAAKSIITAYQNGNRNVMVDCIDAFKDVEKGIAEWKVNLLNKIIERI